VELFGVFVYPFTVASLLTMIVDYGYSLQVVREVAAEPHRVQEIVSRGLRVKLVLATAVLLAVTLAGFVLPDLQGRRTLLVVLTVATIVNSLPSS